jgi:hypothetical protein
MAVRLWVYVPILVAAIVAGVNGQLGVAASGAAVAAGVALWTVLEYLMHRFAFHGFAPHYEHHAHPGAPEYILAPLWLSIPMAALLAGAIWLLTGSAAVAWLAIAGVVAGYLTYEAVHLSIHSKTPGGAALRWLRKYHYYHHFLCDRVCYGVTSPIWDFVFRSVPVRTDRTKMRT